MASSPKLFTSLFLLTLLFLQIHARESHFFSKIPNNNNNVETQIPNKLDDPLTNPEKTTTPQDQQQPNFIPQTQDNGYGLYGHESGQFPPSNNNNNNNNNDDAVSYKSQSEEYYNYNNNNNDDKFQNSNSKKQYENSFYYNNNNNQNLYDNERQSFQNTRLSQDGYTTTNPSYNQENYNNNNDNKNLYDNGGQSFQDTRLSRDSYTTTTTTNPSYKQENYNNFNNNNGRDNANNVAQQGMSDTRFMENGKYFYDLDMEPHHYRRTRGNFENNNYNNDNNGNTYEYGNSMGRLQNDDDAEFQEEQDEFVP